MDVVGIDACGAQGWIGVRLVDGVFRDCLVEAELAKLLARVGGVDAVAVDIPLGLVESGWRAADLRAKEVLGTLRSSVFMIAPRAVWDEPDHPAAGDRCSVLTGNRVSQQMWALKPKILDARACWLPDPARIHEVHPEVSFWALAGERPLLFGKKTWRGQARRRALLAAAGIVLPDELGEADRVPVDDVLDAAAAAWSARRIADGTAGCLPEVPERDAEGRPVAIRY